LTNTLPKALIVPVDWDPALAPRLAALLAPLLELPLLPVLRLKPFALGAPVLVLSDPPPPQAASVSVAAAAMAHSRWGLFFMSVLK
jgi:hypothetical protein